jgi:hypothetical protein
MNPTGFSAKEEKTADPATIQLNYFTGIRPMFTGGSERDQ